jgi:hypothetical protein
MAPSPLNQRQGRETLRTPSIRRPREGHFSAGAERVVSLTAVFLRSPPRVQATAGTSLSRLASSSAMAVIPSREGIKARNHPYHQKSLLTTPSRL